MNDYDKSIHWPGRIQSVQGISDVIVNLHLVISFISMMEDSFWPTQHSA
jgi:hypothetical protein